MKSWFLTLCVIAIAAAGSVEALAVSQQQIQPQQQPQQQQQSHTGSYTTVYSAYSDPHSTMLAALDRQGGAQYGYPPQYQQPTQYAQPTYPPQQQYGYKDPGFSMQTGFEGFLVPNPLYSVLPWGVETVLIAIVGIVIFVAVKLGIIFFLMKILKIGKLFKSDEDVTDVRAYIPSFFNKENLTDLASTVFDAIDRYNEVTVRDARKLAKNEKKL